MLRTISPAEMKRVETEVMEKTSITGERLMQRAAAHVADMAERLICSRKGCVLCLCGTGNNGGDGMAAMRILAERSVDFQGECWVLPGNLSADAVRELDRLAQTQVKIVRIGSTLPSIPDHVNCIIDALFGTGLCRALEGLAKECCMLMNALDAPVIAVDIPSGLNGLTGEILGTAVKADYTVTFHRPKHGLYLKQGPDCAGEIVVGDIGLPARLDDAGGFAMLEKSDLARLLPRRARVSHKGSYGRVLLWAGSRGMAGAAAIAATAALRTGAGLVTVACPDRIVEIVQVLCPCATCLPLPEDADEAWILLSEAIDHCDAVGAGCGLGRSEWAAELLEKLLAAKKPMVLDADVLNLMASEDLQANGAFLTPHPAEAARLLGCSVSDIVADAPLAAQKLAKDNAVILKGACSVLCDGEKMAINPYGTPGMAKGGSGDALTGVMAALLAGRAAGAYAMDDLELMQTACALHGIAGEMAEEAYGERGMLATDLCDFLGRIEMEKPNILFRRKEENSDHLGRPVTVIVERRAGMRTEGAESAPGRLNCGYAQEVLERENRWQDVFIWGISKPLEWFEGVVIASAYIDGVEKWIAGSENLRLSESEVRRELSVLGSIESVCCL
ncbi:MAG: NAD(P)H-hydrate dehydratase [Clostridia bacterium]|nr:NAD(P)H-hydrate dehydratase [Clostridia bacterium]